MHLGHINYRNAVVQFFLRLSPCDIQEGKQFLINLLALVSSAFVIFVFVLAGGERTGAPAQKLWRCAAESSTLMPLVPKRSSEGVWQSHSLWAFLIVLMNYFVFADQIDFMLAQFVVEIFCDLDPGPDCKTNDCTNFCVMF